MSTNKKAIEELTDELEAVIGDEADTKADEALDVATEDEVVDGADEKGEARRVVMVPVAMPADEVDEVDEKEGDDNESLLDRRRQILAELEAIDAELGGDEDMKEGDATPADLDDEEPASMDLSEDEIDMIRMRRRRMAELGMEKDAIDEAIENNSILCGIERKVLGSPCSFCRGGCAPEGNLPGLLDIEAQATKTHGGEVLGSGYAPDDDMFVVDVKDATGRTVEAFYSGAGIEAGWILLDQEMAREVGVEGKDALAGVKVISTGDAAEIALKSLEGDVLGVDAAVFEGYDAWAVQVETLDGKSYDAYISLDGKLLGYDEYTDGAYAGLSDAEVTEVKALFAEAEIKRAFPRERREELAEQGLALPDGSFPIVSVEDLENAIQAYGRASDKDRARAHIMKRARELDADDLIPEEWLEKAADPVDVDAVEVDEEEGEKAADSDTEDIATSDSDLDEKGADAPEALEEKADDEGTRLLRDLAELETIKTELGL